MNMHGLAMELCSMKMNPVNQYCKLTALHKDRLIEYLWVRLSQILIDLVKIEGFFLPAPRAKTGNFEH